MKYKGLIISFNKNRAIVITNDCKYLKIRRENSMYIGETITFDTEKAIIGTNAPVKYISLAASIFLLISFVVFFSPIRNFFISANEYAYIDVDINPSIEFVTDKSGKVLKVISLNEDADSFAKDLKLKGKYIGESFKAYFSKIEDSGLIKENNLALISASLKKEVKNDSSNTLDHLISVLKSTAYSVDNKKLKIVTIKARPEDVREARSRKISIGKSILLDNIKSKGKDMSAEEISSMPLPDIIKMYRTVCGDQKNDNIDIGDIAAESRRETENEHGSTANPHIQMSTQAPDTLLIKTTSPNVVGSATPVPDISQIASTAPVPDISPAASAAPVPVPSHAPAPKGIVPGKYYKISIKHSGKVMDVLLNGMNNGVKVVQYAFNGGTNQMWRIDEAGDGYYKLTAKSSGKCLSVKDNGLNDGAELVQSDYTGGDNQKFNIEVSEDGYFLIIAKHSEKCIGVSGGDTKDRAQICQWSYLGADYQKWKFTEMASNTDIGNNESLTPDQSASKGIVPGKYYKISVKHSGKVMDVLLNGMNNGVKVVQYASNGGTNQMWRIDEAGDGYYKLTAKSSGKCLSVKDNGLNDGAELVQSDYTGGDNQKFNIEVSEDGYFLIIAKHSGKCIGVSGGDTKDSAQICQWGYLGVDYQKWKFTETK